MSEVFIESVSGSAIEPYLGALAALRIEVFRAFPYLYQGTLAYEQRYLRDYAADPRNLVVVARRDTDVLGAATAMPLIAHGERVAVHGERVAEVWAAHGYAPAQIYYFGESVLRASERGKGIGHRFFDAREAAARQHGFHYAAFCAVERPPDHPARPRDYAPLDPFWNKRGYQRQPEISTTFSWRDVGDTQESEKQMVFWLKELAP